MKNLRTRPTGPILLILIIFFVALSFAPCIKVKESDKRYNGVLDLPGCQLIYESESKAETVKSDPQSEAEAFARNLFWGICICCSIAEMALLLKSRRPSASIFGAVLNGIKTAAPVLLMNPWSELLSWMTGSKIYRYSYMGWGCVLLGLGGLIFLLYILDFLVRPWNRTIKEDGDNEVEDDGEAMSRNGGTT